MTRVEYKWLVAATFVFAIFMDLLDLTVVNVALPTLARTFDATSSSLQWVVTGYLLSLAIWIPASGWLGDRFGTKRIFLIALVLFTGGSALCAAAWSIESLVAFRILQGVGGGMLTPVGTAMLFRAFPPHERAAASVVMTVPTVIAPALGPVLGGFLVDYVSWQWIFLINLPVGVLAFFFAVTFVREERMSSSRDFDYAGFVLSGGGLALVLFALSRGPGSGWSSPLVVVPGLLGLAAFAALVVIETHIEHPLLDLRLLRDRMFRNANIVFFAMGAALMGFFFLLPLFLQNLRGLSAMETGALITPQAIAVAAVAPLAGALYPRIGPKRLLAFAMVLFTVSAGLFVFVDLDTSVIAIGAILVLMGVAMAFTFIPLQAATFATINHEATGQASSIFNTNRQVSASIGVAILATVLSTRIEARAGDLGASISSSVTDPAIRHATLLAYHDAFLVGAILCSIGIFFALIIDDRDAAASMRGPAEEQTAAV
jgi:EmrB/QacA subfamily drug resistance transporter